MKNKTIAMYIRLLIVGLLLFLFPLGLSEGQRYYFDNHVLPSLLEKEGAISKEDYNRPVPKIVPVDFEVAIVKEDRVDSRVSFYYGDGLVISYRKGDDWSDYKNFTMKRKSGWIRYLPTGLAGFLIFVAVVLYVLRTKSIIMVGVVFSRVEAELILYSLFLFCGYFLFGS